MSCKLNHDLLDAYIDGELDLVRSLEMEQHLKECPDCAQAAARRRSLVTAMKAAPLTYALPPTLVRDVRTALRRERPAESHSENPRHFWSPWMTGLAMTAAFAVAMLAVVPALRAPSADEVLSRDIVAAHVRSLMAEHLTDIKNSNHHVVKPWFNGRLDFSPPVRDFSDHGFPLAGGRLEYLNGHATAAIVYYRAAHPINLFVWPTRVPTTEKEKAFTVQGYHLVRWSEGGMAYWAISDVNDHELHDFVELLHTPQG